MAKKAMRGGVEPEKEQGGTGLPAGEAGGLVGRMGGMPAGEEGGEVLDERQLDALVEGIQELIFGGDTDDGDLSDAMQKLLVAQSSAPHGAPEIAANVAAQIMNVAVRGAEEQGVILDANVILFGAMVCVDKVVDVMEGETGKEVTPDEMVQALMKALELMYGLLEDLGVFSQREAQAVMEEIKRNPGMFDEEVADAVGDDGSIEAMMRAMGDAPVTAVPDQDLAQGAGAAPPGPQGPV